MVDNSKKETFIQVPIDLDDKVALSRVLNQIIQRLDTLYNNRGVNPVATKDDLKTFVTREDLVIFADLNNLANIY